ncbi:MAG: ABC transporter permease [Acidobacteriota bacterium]|nr:ABC transporter permease [Acidobacteriota bacterium]
MSRPPVPKEVGEELAFHVEMRMRELIAGGMDPARARQEALRRFGDVDQVRTECESLGHDRERTSSRRRYIGELLQDVRYGARQLLRQPAFSILAVLMLALGIGSSTAIFSVVHAVVLDPLPFRDADRLILFNEMQRGELMDVAAGNYIDAAAESRSFEALGAQSYVSMNISEGGLPERVVGAEVTASFFDVFDMHPLHGRVFSVAEDEPGREPVAVLSHRLWSRRFRGDPGAVGATIRINGVPHTVLGVMPASFDLTSTSEELWRPIAFTAERRQQFRDEHYLRVAGRLREGVTEAQAEAELHGVAMRLRERFPLESSELEFDVQPMLDGVAGDVRQRLLILFGAVLLVLLIGCGNVANLLLARGATRARELAVRAALGAGRARLVRQLLAESVLLALVSSAAGVAIAWMGVQALIRWSPPGVPRLENAGLQAIVIGFAVLLGLVTSIVFGLLPAIRAARPDVHGTLKEGGRGGVTGARDRARALLVAAEVAVALVLLTGAGLFVRSAIAVARVDPGFDGAPVIAGRLTLPAARYETAPHIVQTFERLAETARAIPGVRTVGLVTNVPMGRGNSSNGLVPEGKPLELRYLVQSLFRMASANYFESIGMRMSRGRTFTDEDKAGAPRVMIVNESAARGLYPGEDALGRRVACCEPGENGQPALFTIVGIVADVKSTGLAQDAPPEFYLPMTQAPRDGWRWMQQSMYLVVRAGVAPASLSDELRRAVAGVDGDIALFDLQTTEQRMARLSAVARFNMLLMTTLAVVGVVLAAAGTYAVAAFFVSQRTREIGLRMALGATPGSVVRMIMLQSTRPILAGVVAGLVGAFFAATVLTSELFAVQARDPLTFGAVALALLVVGVVASVIPARRASLIDPARTIVS